MPTDARMPSTPTPVLTSTGLWVVGVQDDRRPNGRSRKDELRQVVDEWGRRSSPPNKETLLKEYELIRDEVTTSLQLQQQILGFGIATIGLLAGAAFVSRADPLRSELLVVFLPLVCYLAVTIWFSEVVRMLRAGGFLVTVEKKLDTCGDGSLEWEYGVAKSRLRRVQGKALFAPDPDRLRLLAVTALFFALAAESIMLGWHDASSFARAFAVAVGAAAAILLRLLFGLRVAEWNEVLEIDAESRGTALEARVVRGLRRLVPSFRRRPSTRPRRPSSAPRRRLALTPATAPNA